MAGVIFLSNSPHRRIARAERSRRVRAEKITGTGGKDKAIVVGILERGGSVRATVLDARKKKDVQSQIREHVLVGSAIFTDALKSYEGLDEFQHAVIDHAVAYVDGEVHTNGLENFWSLLKRGLKGTYISVEPFHLFRYVDEQVFRYNYRKPLDDYGRFRLALSQIVGKRLTWDALTGKNHEVSQLNLGGNDKGAGSADGAIMNLAA